MLFIIVFYIFYIFYIFFFALGFSFILSGLCYLFTKSYWYFKKITNYECHFWSISRYEKIVFFYLLF